jgi:hypothetical protein
MLLYNTPDMKGDSMGAYLYRTFGKEFDVIIDGQPRRARMCKYWMKPHWDTFEDALRGHCSSFSSDWEKSIFKKYTLQLGKLNASPAVSVFVISQHENEGKTTIEKRPDAGDRVLIFNREKRYVIDDPNYENATIRYLCRVGGIWEARITKIVEPAKVP